MEESELSMPWTKNIFVDVRGSLVRGNESLSTHYFLSL